MQRMSFNFSTFFEAVEQKLEQFSMSCFLPVSPFQNKKQKNKKQRMATIKNSNDLKQSLCD